MKRLSEDSINPVLKDYNAKVSVEVWEDTLPRDTEEGETNQHLVEMAKSCHVMCVSHRRISASA